jgi:SAM-dependent methyltransferase
MEYVKHYGYKIPKHLAAKTGTLSDFTKVSEMHIETMLRLTGIPIHGNIVEIGCGVGRDAMALTTKLAADGTYLGIDIIGESIEWAKENITKQHKNFEFFHINIKDDQHNPTGNQRTNEAFIPKPDLSIDYIFLHSVFTHMHSDGVNTYMKEFSRVLKSGSYVYMSMFLVDDSILKHLLKIGGGGLRKMTFQHEIENGLYHNDPKVLPGSTAYSLTAIERFCKDTELSIMSLHRGSWSRFFKKPDVHGQDVVILYKK